MVQWKKCPPSRNHALSAGKGGCIVNVVVGMGMSERGGPQIFVGLANISGLSFVDETKFHFITKRKTNFFVIRFVSF